MMQTMDLGCAFKWSLTNFKTVIWLPSYDCLHNGLWWWSSRTSLVWVLVILLNYISGKSSPSKLVQLSAPRAPVAEPISLKQPRSFSLNFFINNPARTGGAMEMLSLRETKKENTTTPQSIKQTNFERRKDMKWLFTPHLSCALAEWFGTGMRETNKIDWEPAASSGVKRNSYWESSLSAFGLYFYAIMISSVSCTFRLTAAAAEDDVDGEGQVGNRK